VLMLGIPARLAGCEEIILTSPPDRNGNIHPAILYTADMLGIDKIFRIGGAQAIGALAYGTQSVPRVYKVFGPGNQFVTMAKQLISMEGIAVDLPAGPSEVAVLADKTADPAFVASDLLAQAEHGADSQVLCVTNDSRLLEMIQEEVKKQLDSLPRKEIVRKSLENGRLVLLNNTDEMLDLVNEYAPEHLILMVEDYNKWSDHIRNAGSVFLGQWTPVSAGDYASGTNHTLPTNGSARAYSGLGLDSFQKKISFQEITRDGLQNLGPAIETLAEAEGLNAHKNSVSIRLGK